MSQRYYLAAPPVEGMAELVDAEAHHLQHVMRAAVGDEVRLFDGSGGEYAGRVVRCQRSRVELAVGSREAIDRELPGRLVIGAALPKGDRQKWLVEKLTELGVAALVPLTTARSVADLRGKSRDRLTRTVVEASKQCGRNQLMRIAEATPVAEFFAAAEGNRWLADPSGGTLATLDASPGEATATLAIGPEGGFTDAELAEATAAGWRCVSLGPSILRIETAAVAMAAIVASRWT